MRRLLLFLLLAAGLRAQVPTLQDFGYESIQRIGRPTRGTVPLLIVSVSFSGYSAMAHSNTYWDNLVFSFGNATTNRTVNGYFLENSLGSFYFTRALTTTPDLVSLNAAETAQVMTPGYDSPGGRTALFQLIAAKSGINWAQWDTNNDGSITQGELCIMVFSNFSHPNPNLLEREAHARGVSITVPGPGSTPASKVLNLIVTMVAQRSSLMTIVHEMTHGLGAETDLYGDGNQNYSLTLMGATIFRPNDDLRSFHLDPWYKMRMGWLRPRIFNLDAGGLVKVRCPQSPFAQTEAEGPVLLYSPSRGSSEYFLIEWRHGNPPAGRGYDAHVEGQQNNMGAIQLPEVPGRGMAVWHVRQAANHLPLLLLNNRLWSAYHLSPTVPAMINGMPNGDAYFNQGAFNYGGRVLWDSAPPPLIWEDTTATGVTINPVRMEDGGNSVIIEWLRPAQHWGDFFSALPGPDGSFARPWQTIATGVSNTPRGGTLNLKASSTAASIIIDKRITIQASHNGPAIIGQ